MAVIPFWISTLLFFINFLKANNLHLKNILAEEVDRREKALADELEKIESQIGYGKNQQQYDGAIASSDTNEVSGAMEEGEENRDPNHELVSVDELTTKMDVSPKIEPNIDDLDETAPTIVNCEIIKPEVVKDIVEPEAEIVEAIEQEEEDEQIQEDENNG